MKRYQPDCANVQSHFDDHTTMTTPHQELEGMLEAMRRAPVPLPAPDFETAVWRRIARQEQTAGFSAFSARWERLAAFVLQPRQVAAALLLVLCGAVGATSLASSHQSGPTAPAVSLGLDVFSGYAPALPSTLMSQHP